MFEFFVQSVVGSLRHCGSLKSEFDGPPKYQIEEKPNEEIADGLILVERGQYICYQCSSIIGEYRIFENK